MFIKFTDSRKRTRHIETNYFTPEEMDNLFDFITNQGGSLVLLGGYNSFGKNGIKTTKLNDAIPVVLADEDEVQVNTPFKLKLTDEGVSSEIFDIAGNPAKNSIVWKMAPELDGYVKLGQPGRPGGSCAGGPTCLGPPDLSFRPMVAHPGNVARREAFRERLA